MNAVIAQEIEKLSLAERIALIDDLWASVDPGASSAAPLPAPLDALLERRYQDSLHSPEANTVTLETIAKRYRVSL